MQPHAGELPDGVGREQKNDPTIHITTVGSITTNIEMDDNQLYEKYPCVEMVRTVESSFSGFGTRVVYTIYYGYYNENGNCFYE